MNESPVTRRSSLPKSAISATRDWPFPALAAFLFVLTLAPVWPIGFTDHDSMYTAIRLWTEDSFIAWVGELARYQGRWHYYVSYPVAAIAFVSTSFFYYKAVSFASLIAAALAFYWAVGRISGSRSLARLTLLVYIVCMQLAPNHSLLTGYYVGPQVIVVGLALSYWFLWKHLKDGNRRALAGLRGRS